MISMEDSNLQEGLSDKINIDGKKDICMNGERTISQQNSVSSV